MYFSMSRKQEIMTSSTMRNDIDFLMKELKKSSSNSSYHNNHHSSDHNCRDNNNKKKDSVIWTLQVVTVHLKAKTDLHKVGRKIIN
jgi:hypothetical protein